MAKSGEKKEEVSKIILVLNTHRMLLADGSIWNITQEMQVFFPFSSHSRKVGVRWPSWTAIKQRAVTDRPEGCLPLPRRIHLYFIHNSLQLWVSMWGVSRSPSFKWNTVNWHSVLDQKSTASQAFYTDGNSLFFWTCLPLKRCGSLLC